MSVEAQSWAWKQEIPPITKLVLLRLANFADQEGECWPSQNRLAKETGISRQTVNRHIAALQEAGLLRIESRFGSNGSQKSSRYFLNFHQGGVAERDRGVSQSATPPVSERDTELSNELSDRNKPPTPLKGSASDFDRFWKVYPRKVDRGHAIKAWRTALKIATAEEIVAGAERYAGEKSGAEARYIAYPASWLHGQRWSDEPQKTRQLSLTERYPNEGAF